MTDWKETTLGELPIQIGDGNYSSKYPNASELLDKGIPFISNKDLCNGRISGGDLRYLSDQKHAELLKGHIKTGDVLVSTRANIGDIALVTKEFNDANINAQLVFLRADEKIVHSKYLFYLLSSKKYRQIFQNFSSGSAQAQLPIHSLKRVPIVYPDISEQKEIAGALSSLDDKIELLREENKTLEATAQAIFKEWFVNFNFPNAEGKPYKSSGGKMIDSELGEIPGGWRAGKIYEAGKVICGKTPSKENIDFFGGKIPFIKIPDMHGQMFLLNTNDKLSKNGADSQKTKTIPKNSICVSCIATVGLVSITTEDSQTNQQINSVVPNEESLVEYLFFALRAMSESLTSIGSSGTTTANVNTGTFMNLEILIPADKCILSFHETVGSMFSKIKENNFKIQTLSRFRDTLLPKLMSGEVRVNPF